MADWPVGALGDIGQVTMGQSPRAADVSETEVGVPLLNGPTEFGSRSPTPVQWTSAPSRIAEVGETLFCVRGSTTGRMNIADRTYAIGRGLAGIRGLDPADTDFLRYALTLALPGLLAQVTGSVFPNLTRKQIEGARIQVPPPPVRRAIAEVLGALDDKIAANTRLVALGSELLDAEYGHALAGSPRVAELGEMAEFHNRRRIPLSSREREGRTGAIPYYGASGVFGWVDEAIFDDRLVLVGEDGSVMTEDRHPVTQYIWGPSWVNNHAHVLSGRGLSTEMLYLAVRRADVSALVTGAVQPKISMGNLKRLEIRLPVASEAAVLQSRVDAWFGTHRALTAENLTLAATRDALLPALMSGALRVRDAERLAADLT